MDLGAGNGTPCNNPTPLYRTGITEHPMYNRVKGPLFEHWKRAFSFALYKQTVECIHHGVTNAKTRNNKATGPTATTSTSTMRTWSRRSAATTTTREHCPRGQRPGVVAVTRLRTECTSIG